MATLDDNTTSEVAAGAGAANRVDAVVVGAGPAGSSAALQLARAGRSVVLLERGPFPGSKNMYGGVIYGRILDDLVPNWTEEMPIQRWVTRRQTMMLTDTQAMTVDFRSEAWGKAPYNGATAFRADFDAWLADHAVAAGARLVCSTTATGLIFDETGPQRRVIGVRTDRPDGDLYADVVIAADGVNSFLAKEAGMYPHDDPANFTVGVKEVVALPRTVIEDRFGVRGRDGVDIEIIGATGDVPGGGFVYTNLDSVAVGLVLSLPALAAGGRRPEELLAGLKAHPAIAPLIDGGDVKEFSAHVIPEAGYDMMPDLVTDGMVVCGDAAAMCLAAGIWLEGVNFAIGAGSAAGRAAAVALDAGDTSAEGLDSYVDRLERSFVLTDHRRLREAPHLVMGDRVQQAYPQLVCNTVERLFRVDNPKPKQRVHEIVLDEVRRSGVRAVDLARDGIAALRTFG
ncbi:MAG: FAD-dependent oxidoreductase [Microthrixaceae bacterium]|nr:FAD-dependent oxidoreductase [Microthrixaceae bacterium]